MYKNDTIKPSVSIMLEPGIHIFSCRSATGKTWLCKHLKKLKMHGEPVNSFTYSDKVNGIDIRNVLVESNKVILLDRYDMYKGEAYDLINEIGKNQ